MTLVICKAEYIKKYGKYIVSLETAKILLSLETRSCVVNVTSLFVRSETDLHAPFMYRSITSGLKLLRTKVKRSFISILLTIL